MPTDHSTPRTLDYVDAPEDTECQLCSTDDGEDSPSPCNNAAEYLFVYEASTDPTDDGRRNALACAECWVAPSDPLTEEVPA